jgi:hypothetical protein
MSLDGESFKLLMRAADFNNKTVTTMSDMAEMATSQEIPRLSANRYTEAFGKILLLRSMEEIDNAEVKRLISLLESPDHKNWHVAEECIKQKLS